ncbi:MAG: hypothetical protein HY558_04500 [Euryarchaeota archaeon]|nr:hypothetical protein [Euryarchaeota archaeon]
MVLAGKLFKLAEEAEPATLARKLKDFRREEQAEVDGKPVPLVTEIQELKRDPGMLTGFLCRDYVFTVRYRDVPVPVQATSRVKFALLPRKTKKSEETLLLVLDKKHRANAVAALFAEVALAGIVEARIPHETLKGLHESNPEATKVIFFDDIDIPNISKLSLYGHALAQTKLYTEYLKHGKIWYVVFENPPRGPGGRPLTVGITRNSIVTLFSRVEEPEFMDYVREEVLPLIS